uniref:Uncharacterized protein n=1 Tax=Tetranychus urticae TaxID=32264 RepID=T1KAP2_TETUR
MDKAKCDICFIFDDDDYNKVNGEGGV